MKTLANCDKCSFDKFIRKAEVLMPNECGMCLHNQVYIVRLYGFHVNDFEAKRFTCNLKVFEEAGMLSN